MLILSRRVGEVIIIDEKIIITTLGIHGNQIRIGISAPRDISIHRQEVFDRIQQAKAKEEQSSAEKSEEKDEDEDEPVASQ